MSQFCSKVKTATFTNEDTAKDFDISVGDYIKVKIEDEEIDNDEVKVDFLFTKNGQVVINCSEGFEIEPGEIIAINGENL